KQSLKSTTKTERLKEIKNIILKRSLDQLNENKKLREKAKLEKKVPPKDMEENIAEMDVNKAGYTSYSYNHSAAALYAYQYGDEMHSPPWGNYEPIGGDCTNFASQCIKDGGVPFDSKGTYTWYWYSDSNRSPSWTGVPELYNYLLNNNSSSSSNYGVYAFLSSSVYINAGDIVQNVGSHTMVIDALDYDSEGWITEHYICQHSTTVQGRLSHYPLSAKPPATRAFIWITRYYK
ncbi:MAG TPA: amidase domain-containing protein, partial [Syntrophomonadaceae bacterium]|nr:amidase domain-containing protein [Syntrophomonadaceae bacterium]